jgi:phosphopentomutase
MTNAAGLGTRKTFADVARTLAEIFGIDYTFPGDSFFTDILRATG